MATGNPFTSAQAPQAMQLLAPDLAAQQAQVSRQQQMADILRSQALQPDQGTQVVNGWAVKKSPLEGVAKLAAALGARYQQGKVDDRQLELAKALQQRVGSAFDAMSGGSSPAPSMGAPGMTSPSVPAAPGDVSQPPAIAAGDISQPGGAPPPTSAVAAEADQITRIRNQARAAALLGYNDLATDLVKNISTLTNEQKNMIGMGQDQKLMGQYGMAAAKKAGIIELQPGTTALNLADGQERFQPKVGEGISLNNGVASAIPGYANASAGIAGASAGAVSGANAQHEMTTVNTPNGPVMMTKAQAVQMAGGAHPPSTGTHFDNPTPGGVSLNFKDNPQAVFDRLSQLPEPHRTDALAAFSQYAGQPAPAKPDQVGIPLKTPVQELEDAAQVKLKNDPLIKFKTDLISNAHASNSSALGRLQDTVRSEFELQNRNAQLLPMLDKIQTGGFNAEGRIAFANALETSGLLTDSVRASLSKWIAHGDPTTGKVVENQLSAAGIKTMLDTLDKEGKPNRAIFDAIHDAQESVKSGNATLKKVFELQTQLYNMHYQQEQDMSHAIAAPDYNPLTMQANFSRRRNDTLTSPATPPPAPAPTKNVPAKPAAAPDLRAQADAILKGK